jgi:hypothetical protein
VAFTQITITASFEHPDGTPAAGQVTASLSEPITNSGVTIDATSISGTLSHAGTLLNPEGQPFTLAATDDTGTTPAGAFYTFTLELDEQPIRAFDTAIPHTAPSGTLDLSTLEPTVP